MRRPRVCVISPFRGENLAEEMRNRSLAASLCRAAAECGAAPFASHVFYTAFLDDAVPSERKAGCECGLAWLEASDLVLVYDANGISEGMHKDVELARALGKQIITVSEIEHVQDALGWIGEKDA